MIGPLNTPSGDRVHPMVNRNAATITANRLVGWGTPATTGERAIDGLNVAGVGAIVGAIQKNVLTGETADVYDGGDLVIESDGSDVITAGQQVIAVAGATLAASGRIARLPAAPVAGTNYEIVGRALTSAAATAGAQVLVRWERYTYQG